MSQLPKNSNDIVPATDDKEQKLKTQKPKLKVVIPLPLPKFCREPVLLRNTAAQKSALENREIPAPTPPSRQEDLGSQKPSEVKFLAVDNTAQEETAVGNSTLQTGKASIPTTVSLTGDLEPQKSTETKRGHTDNVTSKQIIHPTRTHAESVSRGIKQPRAKNNLPATSLITHPLFCEDVSASILSGIPSYSNTLCPTPKQKEPTEKTIWASHPIASAAKSNHSGFIKNNTVQSYLLDFSDCLFEVQLATGTHALYLHSIAIIKNNMFSRLITQSWGLSSFDHQGRIKIEKYSGVVGLSIGVIKATIRTLYGSPLAEILDQGSYTQLDPNAEEYCLTSRMVLATKFFLAGLFLEIDPVIEGSFQAIKRELNFDNVEFAMVFALHGTEYNSDHNPNDEEFYLGCLRGTYLELGASVYGHSTVSVLIACLDFLATEFPVSFSFNRNAPISPGLGGVVLGDDDPMSNLNPCRPRPDTLKAIQFGSLNSTGQEQDRISTILLSAPFPILVQLYDCLFDQGRTFDLLEVLAARNSRYQAKRQTAKALQAGILAKQMNGEGISFELAAQCTMTHRALWHEERIFDETGRPRPTRTYRGDPNISVSNPMLRVPHVDTPLAPRSGNIGVPAMGFNWADEVERELGN